ncbi:MAG TPA: hypothetical protein VL945_02405, partial [Candidatus Saccharimonadales bacterium]|nr:hypothetical protein [Candidatus Saccharimonadales bacterium]
RTKGGVTGQMEGQRLLYEFLISKGLATKDTMFRHAKDYIERNMDRTVSDFVYKMLQMGVPVFFADEGGSTSASYAIKRLALMEIEKLGKVVAMSDRIMSSDSMAFFMEGHGEMLHLGKLVLTDGVFNKEVFDDRNVLVRVKRTISSAEEKLARVKEMLEAHNLALGDVVAICGNPSDGLVLREAGTALIPPSATWEIKDKDIKGAKRMAA